MPQIANRVRQQKITTVNLDTADVLSVMKATALALCGVAAPAWDDAECTVLIEKEPDGWTAQVSFIRDLVDEPDVPTKIQQVASTFWPKPPEPEIPADADSELSSDSNG